ncbi:MULTISPECIES: DUF3800 domain-containing protein [Adlercreutzia]|jgi:hypothetical protein|uniref:DUF3800 domain-containing protein n=1 Tax=Adlercreutzia caecimuris B7 TaxID=1235794 RepID=R9KT79_9ACTN|nr:MULTISPECIES: DUF3800 domain-containing protein [Adlercreutzia]EOS49734.1 hypothetical protein C811_02195 [Adlercreutzia caecimuris B7]MCI8306130.1 DUF3800 domain-containing protein [Enterorhabdus sp.]NCA31579.1 DUF3800 domain-containing protein [Adlercreutzia muris]
MPLELSLFCDESGSDALDSRYYLLTLVIHDQSDSIVNSITRYERALVDKGLPDLAFHASPLLYGKDEYKSLTPETRKKMLSSFRVFFRHLPIKYWVFSVKTREHRSPEDIERAMRRALIDLLFDNLAYFQQFDTIKIYYDNGQRSIADALHKAIDYALSKNAIAYKSTNPTDYRLAQVADYICTIEFTALKYAVNEATPTDEKFFGSWSMFKKGILKEVRHKRM